jgi:FlaA1/EpsC-like NDP-sugar epimerase
MEKAFFIYTSFIVPLTVLFPIYYAFKNYPFLSRAFKIILAFIIFSAVLNAISQVMARGFHLHTLSLFHIYTPFEFAFIIAFFAEFYGKRTRYLMYGLAAAFAVFCLFNTLFIENTTKFDSISRSVDAIILIAYSMLFFYKNNNDLDSKWSEHSSNWIVAGILLYYASSLFMFIFFNMITLPGTMTIIIWTGNATILIIEYVLFAIGFHKCRAQQTISTSK